MRIMTCHLIKKTIFIYKVLFKVASEGQIGMWLAGIIPPN
jgi:hypothetical protein